VLWYFNWLRIDENTEIRGNDIKLHGEPAYPNAAYGHGWDNEGDFSLQGEFILF
jgi:Amt family ammonium transporter